MLLTLLLKIPVLMFSLRLFYLLPFLLSLLSNLKFIALVFFIFKIKQSIMISKMGSNFG